MESLFKKTLVKNEYYILLVLYLVLVIYILIRMFRTADYLQYINNFNKNQNQNMEHFKDRKIKNDQIFSILVNIFDKKKENIFYEHLIDETLSTTYLGTFFAIKIATIIYLNLKI